MKVCFFGFYRRNYSRNVVIKKGLLQNGIEVMECHTKKRGIMKFWDLFWKHRKIRNQYDYLFVPFGGYTLVWFARLLSFRPVVFDVFVSLYLTNIEDRKIASPRSIKARYYSFLDWFSCWSAHKVLLDTNAQIEYFTKKYSLKPEKFVRIFVGSDNEVFYPLPHKDKRSSRFLIHWHGYLVPFYSVETIIAAAKLLESDPHIKIRMVTRFDRRLQRLRQAVAREGLKNIEFHNEVSASQLNLLINEADVTLGVFGNNRKTKLVIPNKIYEAAACGKPIITARHPVVSEVFEEGRNILLVNPEDPEDLKEKIIKLKQDPDLKSLLEREVYSVYKNNLTPRLLGRTLINNVLGL